MEGLFQFGPAKALLFRKNLAYLSFSNKGPELDGLYPMRLEIAKAYVNRGYEAKEILSGLDGENGKVLVFLVSFLIKNGMSLEKIVEETSLMPGDSIFFIPMKRGNLSPLRSLISLNASGDPKRRKKALNLILYALSRMNNLEALKYLVSEGADPNFYERRELSDPISAAAENADISSVQYFLSLGVDLNTLYEEYTGSIPSLFRLMLEEAEGKRTYFFNTLKYLNCYKPIDFSAEISKLQQKPSRDKKLNKFLALSAEERSQACIRFRKNFYTLSLIKSF